MEPVLTVVGVNHQTAAVAAREALSPRPAEAGRFNTIVKAEAELPDAVVLATCSRFEVYGSLDQAASLRLRNYFSRRAGASLEERLYTYRGAEAVGHLFRVAAGLDSWILGESEILGQVKSAYQQACAENSASRALHLAFQRGLLAGKKVRTRTGIVGGIKSIGGAAAVLARQIFANLDQRRVIVFGAGAMAASTVRHLRSKSIGQVWVANRSVERAAALAAELGGEALSLEDGLGRLEHADVAVFSTAAPHYLLTDEQARRISASRAGRPLFLIDLGVPRNVAPEAGQAEGVFLYDIDALRNMVEESMLRRKNELAGAEAILNEETADCWSRILGPANRPTESPRRCPLRQNVPDFRIA